MSERFWFRFKSGVHFGINFLDIAWHPEHCYFEKNMLPNAHLCFSSPLILGSIFDKNLMFLGVSFLHLFFSSSFQDDAQSHDFGTPFGIQLGPKWRPKTARWRQEGSIFIFTVVPRRGPHFLETIVTTVPLGPGGLKKRGSFVRWRLVQFLFCFRFFVLCFI